MARELTGWKAAVSLSFGTLISEDLACVAGGILAGEGHIGFWTATWWCFVGVYGGDIILWFLGRLGGIGLLKRAPLRWWIPAEKVVRAEGMFEQHGAKLIFTSRLLPGSRLPLYVAAGVLRYSFWKFAGLMLIACGIWTPILVAFSMKIGGLLMKWLQVFERYAWVGIASVILIVYVIVKAIEWAGLKR